MSRHISPFTTYIYWLVDTRPGGRPFYCGKTIRSPRHRLKQHKSGAKKAPKRLASQFIIACGDNVRIHVMEEVPPGSDWAARERRWIHLLRATHGEDSTANSTSGGEGGPGATRLRYIKSTVDRKKLHQYSAVRRAHATKRIERLYAIQKHQAEKRAYAADRAARDSKLRVDRQNNR